MTTNPYSDLPAERFWRKAVAGVPPFAVDPRPHVAFAIGREDRVATAGSCFAQRVSEALREAGFRYHVAEQAPEGADRAEAQARQFGTYSARYGNIYHTRQLVQLFDRAYGTFRPELTAWQRPDGRWVDPFRPTIEPAGFANEDETVAARDAHLAQVRALFESLDVFVLTLGLNEGWRFLGDGAALPIAPGVVAGTFDPERYACVTSGAGEIAQDLRDFLARLRGVNPASRVIVTVSPVPMIATYRERHVLESNGYSKAVLRAAAGEVCDGSDPSTVYFPSYEIITGSGPAGRYFNDDLRTISDAGVAHVMRTFLATFAPDRADLPGQPSTYATPDEFAGVSGVICDEEEIERSVA